MLIKINKSHNKIHDNRLLTENTQVPTSTINNK